jgi:serine/threonine protein kinase
MTKFVGTPRYMSPEVLAGGPYGLAADVYSYAGVLWEVSATSLRRPYALVSDLTATKRSIAEMKYRPPLHHVSNRRLRSLVKSSWDPRPQVRPTFSVIVAELQTIRGSFSPAT